MIRALAIPAAIVALGVPIVAHAVAERRADEASQRDGASLAAMIERLAPVASLVRPGEARRLRIAGAGVAVRVTATGESPRRALDTIAAECASGDDARSLGDPTAPLDGAAHRSSLELVRTSRSDRDDAAAILCVFRKREGGGSRVRYAFARTTSGGGASVVSVSTLDDVSLEAMFPAEGDAPGIDLPDVPRPPASRRTFAADLDDDHHAVRVYESARAMGPVIDDYDAAMTANGWHRSAAVAETMPRARLYTRDGRTIVASFKAANELTEVAVAQIASQPR